MNFEQPQQPSFTLKEIGDPLPDNFEESLSKIKDENVREFVTKYFWNAPRVFIRLQRVFRLLEIMPRGDAFKKFVGKNQIDIVKDEYNMLKDEMKKAEFVNEDSLFVENYIQEKYSNISPFLHESSIPLDN